MAVQLPGVKWQLNCQALLGSSTAGAYSAAGHIVQKRSGNIVQSGAYSAKMVGAYSAAGHIVQKRSGHIVQSGAYSAKMVGAYSAEWGI